MAAITINITEQQLQKLQSLAPKLGISTEELLSASLEDLLNYPKSKFSILPTRTRLYEGEEINSTMLHLLRGIRTVADFASNKRSCLLRCGDQGKPSQGEPSPQ